MRTPKKKLFSILMLLSIVIAVQAVPEVGHLCRQCFLHTHQVWLLEVDKVDEVSFPRVLAVAGVLVVVVLVPDVVGTDREFLCLCRKDSQQDES